MDEQDIGLLSLNDLPLGARGVIHELADDPGLQSRMRALGLCHGRIVQVVRRVHFGTTLQVRVGNTDIALRAGEAALIGVEQLAA